MRHHAFILGLAAAALLAAPALANHGKVGLWNVTSTLEITLPADVAKAARSPRMIAPAPVTVQMCMSKEEVEADTPPHVDRGATGCDTKLVAQTADFMRARMMCKGQLKGTGTIEIYYKGTEHYNGSYSFKGTSYGRPTDTRTTFKGDWVKADCGKVQPYKLRTQ